MSHLSPLGYSVLSPAMTEATFGAKAVEDYETGHYTRVLGGTDLRYVNDIMEEMEKFGVEFPIKNPESFTGLPEFYIPPLRGDNISEHFDNIGGEILSGKSVC